MEINELYQGMLEIFAKYLELTENGECLECEDDDNDGVCDEDDECPDSIPGEPVDEEGCDPFQFCGKFYCSVDCFYADFKNNEQNKTYPYDCTVVIFLREGTHGPGCVPLTCLD